MDQCPASHDLRTCHMKASQSDMEQHHQPQSELTWVFTLLFYGAEVFQGKKEKRKKKLNNNLPEFLVHKIRNL